MTAAAAAAAAACKTRCYCSRDSAEYQHLPPRAPKTYDTTSTSMMSSDTNKQTGFECPKCKNRYSTAYSMYRHMRKVHNCDINRCVTLYCPIENCNESYDRYNALDTHLTHVHYIDIRKETFSFSDLSDFEAWLRDITSSSKTKYIKRSCNSSYRYYRCHRSGLPKTSTERITSMKSSVKIGRHCPSRIIAKITDRSVQVEFVPTHIGHECEISKIPLSQKKRLDIACRLATSTNSNNNIATSAIGLTDQQQQQQVALTANELDQRHSNHQVTETDNQELTMNSGQAGLAQGDSTMLVSMTRHLDQNSEVSGVHPMQQQQMVMMQSQAGVQLGPNGQPRLAASSATNIASTVGLINNRAISQSQNISLMRITSPNKQELASRFEQLVSSIRSDKHANIVRAQLEVCFALIRD